MPLPSSILAYNAAQSAADKKICDTLAKIIDAHLAKLGKAVRYTAQCKGCHSHPAPAPTCRPILG